MDTARGDIFVLSTFVAAQDDSNAHLGQNRVWVALERAVRRGVRVHLFFGSSLDEEGKHMRAMAELQNRLALQLRFYLISESLGYHDFDEVMDVGIASRGNA